MKTMQEYREFVERIEDAAQYDDVATYLTLKRWARLNYGDNPPACVERTLRTIRAKFSPEQIERLIAVPRTSSRSLANETEREK